MLLLLLQIYAYLLLRSQVQRIVITSSGAAVSQLPVSEPTVFSELDWNESSIKEVQALGNKASPMSIYCASKSLAEKGILYLNTIFLISSLTRVR